MTVPGGSTLSILVVDDDAAVAELLRTLLNRVPGWGATVVHEAAAAREVFRHVRVDVLILDVNLPDASGIELLRCLRCEERWDEPCVVLISANADQPEIAEELARGVVQFIPKPFDLDEIVRAVAAGQHARRLGASDLAPRAA